MIFGLKELATHGWRVLPVVAALAGVGFAAIFVRRQRRLADPLLDLGLLRDRIVSVALLLAMGGAFVSGGIGLMAVLFLQLVEALTPVRVGLLLLVPAVALVIAGNLTPFLARKVRPGYVLAAGMLVAAAGLVVITQTSAVAGLAVLLGGLVVVYLGSGPVGSLIPFLVMSAASREKAGSVGSLPGPSGSSGWRWAWPCWGWSASPPTVPR